MSERAIKMHTSYDSFPSAEKRRRRTEPDSVERLVNADASAAPRFFLSLHYPNYDMFTSAVQIGTCTSDLHIRDHFRSAPNEDAANMIDRAHMCVYVCVEGSSTKRY